MPGHRHHDVSGTTVARTDRGIFICGHSTKKLNKAIIKHMPILMREAGIDDEAVECWCLWMNALHGSNPPMLAYL